MDDSQLLRAAAWMVAAVLVAVAGWKLLAPERGEGAPPSVRVDGGAADARAAASGGERLYVHIAGAVRRPGLYRVAQGARVAIALERAGGPLPRADLTAVNLAATLEDGQQILVPRRGAALAPVPQSGVGTGSAAAGAAAQISLATATLEQLEQIDGIGPTLGQRILDYRDANGGFRSVDELQEVDGIGEKRFATLSEAVRP